MIEIGIIIVVFGSSAVTAGDLALGQPANMVNNNHTATLAVDGTTSKCAVTSPLTDPWWRVDLGMSYIVEEVKIISGVDGLTNLEIRIGDSLDNEGNSNQQCGAGPYTMTSSQEKSFHCTPGMRGRYVNIRTTGNNKKLGICEVLVNPNPTVNLALVSQHPNLQRNTMALLDELQMGTLPASGTCPVAHTPVNRVGYQARLVNIEIRVGDSLTNNGNSNPRCGGLYSMATLYKASFYCKPRKTGRYLNIRLVGNGMVLTLCEVEVYSESRAILRKQAENTNDKRRV
ncbi:hypothetical protein OS493_036499 [Desmophyllum pertusum]|uniref:Fucolectin tachylectin-4 pentraxin-1 domain-containing protein n=1 Tax=Desmophyllum pertusum TaxID=174260 RepID=A0A9X0D6T6_9CNID|nr:hypothetical protein OS493_036499 [Desmophyllum pertusum]